MKRILILGSAGSGKSTLAKWLGEMLNVEVIHLDSYFWNPGWMETPKDEWKVKLSQLLEKDNWVMDGNWADSLEERFSFADTVVFIDLPRVICLWRVIKRYFKYRNQTRPDMGDHCNEKIDFGFLKWIWNYPNNIKPIIIDEILKNKEKTTSIILKSKKDVEKFQKTIVVRVIS
ncbi:MAG: DNA topology modulation protein [Candidatus Marinimicrobia bacterium]|nr:DNA topology modulation protein [Candidatus Neomarinimicrobiota bacterium]MBL7022802.1 DNA topology modulation protein [Candidatus Neomarinimicrobiota bacterium]MBL7109369.1 DNA topology modulation protein [Candidatus Neomarinimicrobiota bacterium]